MNKKRFVFLLILTLAVLAFIWCNSAVSADRSSRASGGVTAFLKPLLELVLGEGNATEALVRKLAHFAEYLALGALLIAALRQRRTHTASDVFACLFFCLLAAVVDETIQLFADGRGSSTLDVLLDFGGALTGALLAFLPRRRQRPD